MTLGALTMEDVENMYRQRRNHLIMFLVVVSVPLGVVITKLTALYVRPVGIPFMLSMMWGVFGLSYIMSITLRSVAPDTVDKFQDELERIIIRAKRVTKR